MILQALKDYYDRKAADPESGIAPLGWERKPIPFLVVIDEKGDFIKLEDTRRQDGKKKIAKTFIVPSLGEAKGNGVKANLFWENAEYFFGINLKQDGKKDRSEEQHQKFKDEIYKLNVDGSTIPCFTAIMRFFRTLNTSRIISDPLWQDVIKEKGANFLFSVVGVGPVTDRPEIRRLVEAVRDRSSSESARTLCLVTGEQDVIAKLEPTIGGFAATGAHLVSVNNKVTGGGNGGATPAFASFNKEQGENSPIGKRASLAYTTALNTLLARDSRQKMHIGDATVVFWADRDTTFVNEMVSIFDDADRKDNPDALTGAVAQLLTSVRTGSYHEDHEPTRFFVLGLAPNSTRLSVRLWHEGTVEEMAGRFASWFEDLMIVHGSGCRDHLSMYSLLCSIAPSGKSENVPPNLAGNVMRAILDGLPLPETLLQAALRRNKAEKGDVSYPRAKLIRACLNRKFRNSKSQEKEITIMLDKENENIGYRLGRLFAVLEKIQEAANPGINATIRDKYYASASAAPATVFGTLMRLASNHLSKLGKEMPGWKVSLEKLLGEITYRSQNEVGIARFPAHLKLDDQGQFAIGYYHQRQDFFTKKADAEATSDK